MQKILVLVVALSIFLFSSEVDSSLQVQYNEGLQSYKAKDFKKSYEVFSKLYLSNLSDAKLNFYFGRSAYEIGEYEVALAAFERVEMLDPSSLRNRLEMGRTYYMLKMYEDAELAFKEVLDNPNIPQNVRTNIELHLSNVTKVQQKSFTYATIKVDVLYDSNVNYGSLDDTYDITAGTYPTQEASSDTAIQAYANVTNVYDIGSKNGFAIKNQVNIYSKNYNDFDEYNVLYLSYTPSLIYKRTSYLLELSASYDFLQIDSKNYLSTLGLMPRAEYSHTKTLKSLVHFKYQQKKFLQDEQRELDASHYELAYSLQKILNPRSYLQGSVKGILERTQHGTRNDVDYAEYRVSVSYANQFTSIFGTELFGEYRKRMYDNPSTLFFDTKRDDDAISLATSLNAKILPTLRVHLKGTYDRVESNHEVFSYEKYTATLGVNKTF